MKFVIKHESRGRLRAAFFQSRMSFAQADQLELYLQQGPGVRRATVHERTRCAVIEYNGPRTELLGYISRFSYASTQALAPIGSARAINRAYEERLIRMVLFKAVQSLYFPAPLRMAYTLVRSLPYLLKGLRCLWKGGLHMEVLDALSIGISMFRGDFTTASSVMFLLGLGELLEEWTRKKSVEDLARCLSLNIQQVWLKTPEGDRLVPLGSVQGGDLVCVQMGGVIPLDGVIYQGEVMVNQSSLTGEAIPVPKRPGMAVYAGTVVEEGQCVLQVEKQPGASRYDRIVELIQQSEQLKSAAESRAANLADRLVPYTLLGSMGTYLLTRNLTRALSVLMVDFSCALKLSMPLAVMSAMREAGGYHITVKGGKYLEALAQADTIVLDKTGTLTYACPVVAQVVPFGGHDPDEMLRLAACLEEHFPHSMANAVVRAAREKGLSHEEMHSQVEYLVAHGIASTISGQEVCIGSAHFIFEDEGSTVPPEEQEKFDSLPAEYSHLYLAIGGQLAAVICIHDPLRTEARAVLDHLRSLGIRRIVMLTGDSRRTAQAIALQVGADEFQAEVLPEDKARFVELERARGRRVIMVGDGVNDSPALSAADVGVAISDGAAIAREVADITIAAHSLWELAALRRLSMALMGRIRSNYRFVIAFNGGLITLGAAGLMAPATSAMLHNLSTLGVSLRSMTNLLGGTGLPPAAE